MKSRRFEHADKNRFFELFWEENMAEVTSGTIGTKGRTRKIAVSMIPSEIRTKLQEGYVEVLSEAKQVERTPAATIAPEWFARIAEAFDDDEPRRVLADWLQTQGDPLGELIAIQCERARLDPWDSRCAPLLEREEYLLATYRKRWQPPGKGLTFEFHRGFPERIKLDSHFELESGKFDRAMEAAPLIRTLEMRSLSRDILASSTRLGVLTGLYRSRGSTYMMTAAALDALLALPELAAVQRLGLSNAALGGGDVKPLAARTWLELDLHGNAFGARGTEQLLASALQLRALDISNAGVGDDGVQLFAGTSLPRLKRLSLSRSNLTDRATNALSRASGLAALRELDLSTNPLGRAGALALFEAPILPALVALDLTATDLDDHGAIALARSPLAARLEWLAIGDNRRLGTNGMAALVDTGMPALRKLLVSGVNAAAAQLAKQALPHARVVARGK